MDNLRIQEQFLLVCLGPAGVVHGVIIAHLFLSSWPQIAEISRSIILDWVVAQHGRILEWTGRALDIEVGLATNLSAIRVVHQRFY